MSTRHIQYSNTPQNVTCSRKRSGAYPWGCGSVNVSISPDTPVSPLSTLSVPPLASISQLALTIHGHLHQRDMLLSTSVCIPHKDRLFEYWTIVVTGPQKIIKTCGCILFKKLTVMRSRRPTQCYIVQCTHQRMLIKLMHIAIRIANLK